MCIDHKDLSKEVIGFQEAWD